MSLIYLVEFVTIFKNNHTRAPRGTHTTRATARATNARNATHLKHATQATLATSRATTHATHEIRTTYSNKQTFFTCYIIKLCHIYLPRHTTQKPALGERYI
jgi:hypothetical protein